MKELEGRLEHRIADRLWELEQTQPSVKEEHYVTIAWAYYRTEDEAKRRAELNEEDVKALMAQPWHYSLPANYQQVEQTDDGLWRVWLP